MMPIITIQKTLLTKNLLQNTVFSLKKQLSFDIINKSKFYQY